MGRKSKASKQASTDKAVENNQEVLPMPSSPVPKNTTPKHANKSDVRRSGRLQKLISPAGTAAVAEEIDLTLAENIVEDEPPLAEKINPQHSEEQDKEDSNEEHMGTEQKLDYLYKTAKQLKSKASKRAQASEELNYKNLYNDSQGKIEALTEENVQLAKKLEHALGKIEVYEKMYDTSGKFKDMIVLTNLGRVTDSVLNHAQDAQKKSCADKNTSPPPQRKTALNPAQDTQVNSPQPKADEPNIAQDTQQNSCLDTGSPKPASHPKAVVAAAAAAATRMSKRNKSSQDAELAITQDTQRISSAVKPPSQGCCVKAVVLRSSKRNKK